MLRHAALFALFVLLTGIGLVGGWFAARQAGGGGPAEPAEDAHAADDPIGLDAKTLANLGVRIEAVKLGGFTHYRQVQAVVEDRPQNAQPVVAPLGGIVTAVHTEIGGVAAAGVPIVTLVRDPIARPKPELTADILTPISEDVHQAVSSLRSGLGRMKIVDANLQRIRKSRGPGEVDGVRVLRKSEIDFENERARLLVEIEEARHELERHGLEAPEIQAVERGEMAPPNRHLWQHALQRSGLWAPSADEIRKRLPARDRDLPWCIVALGELSAAGLATPELVAAVRQETGLSEHFAEAAGLLLQGMPLPMLRLLAKQGALAAEIVVRAPAGVAQWDVAAVAVRPGERVNAGTTLAQLHDPSTMWLRLEPVGEEVGLVARALGQDAPMQAVPLVKGSGPGLEDIRLQRIATRTTAGHHAGHGYAEVRNALLGPSRAPDAASRSWTLRAGTRYLVKVPLERMENCFVLPAGAVTSRGPDRILFVQDGSSFRTEVVRVAYEDDAVIVVPNSGSIFEGDRIAMSGAFALKLALDQEGGGGDDAAAHGHAHQ